MLPGKIYNGHVSFIFGSIEFMPKKVQVTKKRVKLEVRIKIDIPNQRIELKLGMLMDAEIVLEPDA